MPAGLGDDVGFAFVILGVEHLVLHAHFGENRRELLALGDGNSADQHGLALGVALLDFLGGVAELLFLGAIDDIVGIDALGDLVGRDRRDVQLVGLAEFGSFGFGRTGHAAELLVHAEVVLEGDGRQRLIFSLNFDVFLGFDGLMEAIGPAAAGHEAAGEFVDDNDFQFGLVAGADDVILIAVEHHVGLEGLLHVVIGLDILRVV